MRDARDVLGRQLGAPRTEHGQILREIGNAPIALRQIFVEASGYRVREGVGKIRVHCGGSATGVPSQFSIQSSGNVSP